MNGWDYRVIKKQDENATYFTIAEVYYDEKNYPVGWIECKENALKWEEYDNLKGTIDLIIEAFNKPILIIQDDRLKEVN